MPRKVNKRRALTPQSRKLLEVLADNPDLTLQQAGELAGYPAKCAKVAAHKALKSKSVNTIWREMMERDPKLNTKALQKRLAEGLDAKKIQYFADKGVVTDERETIDYGTRATYLGLAVKVAGAEAPLKQELSGPEGEPVEFEGTPITQVPLETLLALINRLTAEEKPA
jgi:hypothetical protein